MAIVPRPRGFSFCLSILPSPLSCSNCFHEHSLCLYPQSASAPSSHCFCAITMAPSNNAGSVSCASGVDIVYTDVFARVVKHRRGRTQGRVVCLHYNGLFAIDADLVQGRSHPSRWKHSSSCQPRRIHGTPNRPGRSGRHRSPQKSIQFC